MDENVRHIYSQLNAGEIRNHKAIPLIFLPRRFFRDNRSLKRLRHILRDLPGTPREQGFIIGRLFGCISKRGRLDAAFQMESCLLILEALARNRSNGMESMGCAF